MYKMAPVQTGFFTSWPAELSKLAQLHPNKQALGELTNEGNRLHRNLTFAQLWHASLGAAQWLCDYGLKANSRFAIVGDDSIEHVVLWTAASLIGAIVVTTDTLAPLASLMEIIEDSQPDLVLVLESTRSKTHGRNEFEQLRNACLDKVQILHLTPGKLFEEVKCRKLPEENRLDAHVEAPWAILYTSGTTGGKKKGVVRNQRGSILGYFAHLTHMHFRPGRETFLAMYPLHGISSFFFVTMMLYMGQSVLLLSRQYSSSGRTVFNALNTFPITFITGGPAHLVSIIDHAEANADGRKLPRLKTILASGAMTSSATQERIRRFFASASFFEVYGSTEAGIISILDPEDFQENRGSVGFEPSGVSQIIFVDPKTGVPVAGKQSTPGEIAVRTPMMCQGYWRRSPELIDGWFRTGDMGYRCNDGFIYLLGRADDRITLPTGASFYPSEIERVLLQHELVSQAVVFWDEATQMLAGLFLARVRDICDEQNQSQAEKEIINYCKDSLADHLVPNTVLPMSEEAWAELPRTATRKVLRSRLNLQSL